MNNTEYLKNLLSVALGVREHMTTWNDVVNYAREHGETLSKDSVMKGFKYAYRLYDAGLIVGENDKASNDIIIEPLMRKVIEMKQGDATWADVRALSSALGEDVNLDNLRKGFLYALRLYDAGLVDLDQNKNVTSKPVINEPVDAPKIPSPLERAQKTSIETKADGSRTYSKVVELIDGVEELTEEQMLGFFGLSAEKWIVTSSRLSAWEGQTPKGETCFYSLKISIRPKMVKELGLSDIEAFFDRNKGGIKTLPEPKIAEKKTIDGNQVIKQIDLADPHFGLLAWKPETGEHYDLQIASEYTLSLFRQFVERNRGQRIDKIVLVTMGDIIHVDNGNLETTHGTKQDTEGRIPKMLDIAVSTLTSCVRMLKELNVPIKYVYIPGNHDQNLGYATAKMVEACFYGDPNVEFDTMPSLFKCMEYGVTSVSITHGEPNNRRLASDLMVNHRASFGRTLASEIHAGHLHSDHSLYSDGGIMIRRVPAVCESSYWEKSKGYPAVGRGMQAFTYWTNVPGAVNVEYYYTHASESYVA